MRTLDVDLKRVKRLTCCHKEAIPPRTAEAEIGADLWEKDLADLHALRGDCVNTVAFGFGRTLGDGLLVTSVASLVTCDTAPLMPEFDGAGIHLGLHLRIKKKQACVADSSAKEIVEDYNSKWKIGNREIRSGQTA